MKEREHKGINSNIVESGVIHMPKTYIVELVLILKRAEILLAGR